MIASFLGVAVPTGDAWRYILGFGAVPAFLASTTTFSAIEITCRLELPEQINIVSVTEDFSATSISMMSRPFRSSTLSITKAFN